MAFFEGTILDEYSLNKDRFEAVIGLGAAKKEVLKIFEEALKVYRKSKHPYASDDVDPTMRDLDDWVKENYNGMSFNTVYELVQSLTKKKFEEAMLEIGLRGNSSAIGIMNEVIRGKEDNSIVKVVFNNNLDPEGGDDDEEK